MKSFTSLLLVWAFGIIFSAGIFAQESDKHFEKISNAVEKGNSSELAEYFNTTIDLSVPGKEGTYSKVQSELIIKEFFENNKPVSFKINHNGSSNDGSQYAIGSLKSANQSFRLYFLVKKTTGKYLIHQLEIEEE